ncbi:hypothetical protein [Micromonospora sp. U21]|uniref:hypothetical protein n=1 Tax=Micromonospora sp. U21 TaxID=2824899 RepID=UPI001B37391E|nr:hypothetical protein [Micromonospora sp. U21]MBQ0906417.1 hypothetical protein [Micromonospora sp. U21]
MTFGRGEFGFWRNVARTSVGQLVGLEGLLAVILGCTGGILLIHTASLEARVGTAGDILTLGSALVGVVFAGFALVIALLSDRYLLLLEKSPSGTKAFLAPFMINIGVQVFVVILSVAYRAAAKSVPPPVEKVAFVALCVLFIYAALNIVALARSVLAHGATRAEQATIDELQRIVDARRRAEGMPESGGRSIR